MARPLQIGIQLPEAERFVPWPEYQRIATTAEEVGFDSLWVGDHLLYRHPGRPPVGPWEAWTALAALAAVTSRVQLGPLVAATSFHNPAMLAKKAATIDAISGGRLVVGLGAGWNEVEYRAFGYPFDHRASRFEEAFTIIRNLLSKGAIDFAGRFYTVRDCVLDPPPFNPGGPPLMIGSLGPRVLATTAPHVDMWNAWYAWFGNQPDQLAPLLERVRGLIADAGRDPSTVEYTVAVLVELPDGSGRRYGRDEVEAVEPLAGSLTAIAAGLAAYADLGVGHLQLVLDPITVESVETMGKVVGLLDA